MAQGPAIMTSAPPPMRDRLDAGPTSPPTMTTVSAWCNLAAGELERLEDRQHLFDAGDGRQRLGLQLALVADDADDGALLAAAEVRLEAQFADALQDVVDLLLGGVGSKNNNHGQSVAKCGERQVPS